MEKTETATQTPRKNSILNTLKVVVEIFLTIGFIVWEEIIWEWLIYPTKEWLTSLKIFTKLQAHIEKQNTIVTLVWFATPFVAAEALSVWSTGLIVTGHILLGVTFWIAKVPVAASAFWVFSFSKEKLLALDWFNTLYVLINRGFDWVKSTKIYKRVKDQAAKVKEYIKSLKGEGDGQAARFAKVYKELKKLFREKGQSDQ